MNEARTFTMFDTLQPHEPKETESAGTVVLGPSGIATTSRPEVADEIKARYPHMRVVEHEPLVGGRAVRAVTFTLPLTLREIEERYKHYQEAQQGAVVPQVEHGESETI